jgi:hypothetical protein
VYEIGPNVSTAAVVAGDTGEQAVQGTSRRQLARTFRINVAVGDAQSYTYSLEYVLLV